MRKVIRKGGAQKWVPIVGGIICGFLFMWFFGEISLQDEMFFGERLFEEMNYLDYKRTAYLIYLIKIRGLQMAFVFFMSCIHRKKLGLGIWAYLIGCGCGIGICAMIEKWGLFGIPGYFMMIFPHYLCYLFSYSKYYEIDQMGQNMRTRRAGEDGGMIKKIAIIGVVIIGIILECYVNPFFIKLFSKIFL